MRESAPQFVLGPSDATCDKASAARGGRSTPAGLRPVAVAVDRLDSGLRNEERNWCRTVSTPRRSTFERCALASGLLSEDQLRQARAALERSPPSLPGTAARSPDELLAAKLVELGWLNAWQAKQLSEGRSRFDLGGYYRIVDYIGRGGMGEVYKAEHGVLGRTVAIKVLRRRKSTPEEIANFLREARLLARLDHENLVRAFDAGEEKGDFYIVTEYVAGSDLRKLVRANGPLSMSQAASIISQVAAALQHAHEQGLVHRDVKPGNVLVTPEGRAKLSDLGLAGPLHAGSEEDPRAGKIVGTADYLSPDHIEAPWNPTPAWDIYSLGCTLYYAVTGKVPFPGGSTVDKVRAHLYLRPLDPRRLNPRLSDAFVDVMADMMAKNPAERIASAREVVTRLAPWVNLPAEAAVAGEETGRVSGGAEPEWCTRHPTVNAGRLAETEGLEDTQGSVSVSGWEGSPGSERQGVGQSSQVTRAVASAAEETRVALDSPDPAPSPSSLFGPFAALVLFPLAVVATILLLWWIAQSLR